MKKIITILIISVIVILFVSGGIFIWQRLKTPEKINGLMMLIESEKIDGVLHWEEELDKRGLSALIMVKQNILEQYPEDFKRLAQKGYEIAGSVSGDPVWDKPYEYQYEQIKKVQELVENITEKPMRVLSSRYFAYDQTTLRVANELGIEYVLARGTAGEKAIVYAPKEYNVKIISVSNIPFEEMGTGSLCDYSLWARGADANDFATVLNGCIDKKPTNMILVSHAYLGGTRLTWWNVYEKALNSGNVYWKTFNDWMETLTPLVMDNKDIPVNREVKYEIPTPKVPLEELELIPDLNSETMEPICY
ncbi:MAG: polysaccharide deacetylase family protein [Candidatus Paceibacterota bacterium]|jgi:peptidoglycan/xylan/chitin deacetylase (PgdA/CDA1 family)|nr:polysaccharide deacetylase family protein [Candidatus Paceibacterota bacterium]